MKAIFLSIVAIIVAVSVILQIMILHQQQADHQSSLKDEVVYKQDAKQLKDDTVSSTNPTTHEVPLTSDILVN